MLPNGTEWCQKILNCAELKSTGIKVYRKGSQSQSFILEFGIGLAKSEISFREFGQKIRFPVLFTRDTHAFEGHLITGTVIMA